MGLGSFVDMNSFIAQFFDFMFLFGYLYLDTGHHETDTRQQIGIQLRDRYIFY